MSQPVPLLSSERERRLWAWILIVVVAIYSTFGLAGMFADAVSQDLLAAGFLLCMFLVVATIVTQGLRARPGGAEIGIALGMAALLVAVMATVISLVPSIGAEADRSSYPTWFYETVR